MRIVCSVCSHEANPRTLGLCRWCGGLLQPRYSDEAFNQLRRVQPGPGLDRYRAVLPAKTAMPFLGEGDTPLIHSRRIGPALGLPYLYFKYEGRNPTGAFKDRAASLAVALALDSGAKGLLTASSGNAAAAIAAYSAAAGLPCLILLEPGNPPAKVRQALATGATVLPVEGLFTHGPDKLRELLSEVAARLDYYLAFVWAPVNPCLLEGLKTIAYEIVARLPGAPDCLVCPVGGGDLLAAQWRGYCDLSRAARIDVLPRLIGVQSASAAPLLHAFENHAAHVTPLDHANSQISGINVAFTGDHALQAVYDSKGAVASVTDDEIFAMQKRLGTEEGLWVEPASAAPVAALGGLLARGAIRADEWIVCLLTGAGFKDSRLAEAEAAEINRREPAPFDVEAIVKQTGRASPPAPLS